MSRALARSMLLAALTALVAAPLAAIPADAQGPGEEACARHDVPATPFTDTTRSIHREAIDCIAWWQLTRGVTETRFAPGRTITRAETAAFLDRLLAHADRRPGDVPRAGFEDTRGHTLEDEIDRLTAAGVIEGVSPTTFEPDRPLTRAQMATLLDRTLSTAFDLDLPDAPMPFVDVPAGNVHHDAIGRIADAGITVGVAPDRYGPGRLVTREQMASFLTRAADRLVAAGETAPPSETAGPDDAYRSTRRGAWVHLFDDTLKSRESIDDTMAAFAEADMDVVVAQVARRHDAYYDSQVLPATPDPQLEDGLDVLDHLTEAAADHGLEVQAWVSVAPTWHGVYDDLDVEPGDLGAPNAWRTRTHGGDTSQYLDPGLDEVRAHVADIAGELASDYDIDAVHLDYVRYESSEHGYHPDALERFRTETGVGGTPAPDDDEWGQWRRDQTRQIIADAREAVAQADPEVDLTAATITWGEGPSEPTRDGFQGTLSQTRVLQDWDRWVREGLVDEVMPMNYYEAQDSPYPEAFADWMAYQRQLTADTGVPVTSGVGGFLNAPDDARDQTYQAMDAVGGALLYSFQQPTADGSRGILRDLAATRWGYPPPAP